MGIIWAGYAVGIWGYCLVKNYDVTFGELFASTWPGAAVNVTAPTAGHKLGTITGSTSVTDPGQLSAEQGQ
jgi:hypothetical protein